MRSKRQPAATPPTWATSREAPKARVLVEHADRAARDLLVEGLRARGYDAMGCAGPRPEGQLEESTCPLLHGESCPSVTDSDVVLSSLRIGGSLEKATIEALVHRPDTPGLILEATDWQLTEAFGPDGPSPTHTYPFSSLDQVVEAIEGVQSSSAPSS